MGASGSAAVFNLLSYLVILRAAVAREIQVIMTPAANDMLPASTVAFACDGIFVDGPPTVDKRPGHVELASWSDIFLVLPASANLLGQAATGTGKTAAFALPLVAQQMAAQAGMPVEQFGGQLSELLPEMVDRLVGNPAGVLPSLEQHWARVLPAPVNGGFSYGNNFAIRDTNNCNGHTVTHADNFAIRGSLDVLDDSGFIDKALAAQGVRP